MNTTLLLDNLDSRSLKFIEYTQNPDFVLIILGLTHLKWRKPNAIKNIIIFHKFPKNVWSYGRKSTQVYRH